MLLTALSAISIPAGTVANMATYANEGVEAAGTSAGSLLPLYIILGVAGFVLALVVRAGKSPMRLARVH